jgi:Arc/MetJ-type ribon-helix-helix transcriptional regulator
MPRRANPNRLTRVTFTLPENTQKILDQLAANGLYGASRSDVLRFLTMKWMSQQVTDGRVKLNVGPESALGVDKDGQIILPFKKTKSKGRSIIRNKALIVRYSKLVIFALQEALEYDPARHHNQPPPDLRIEDDEYLKEIRNLVSELQRLNDLLEDAVVHKAEAKRTVVNIAKHTNTFLDKYAGVVGKGAGYLTVGLLASILYQAGISSESVTKILAHISIFR